MLRTSGTWSNSRCLRSTSYDSPRWSRVETDRAARRFTNCGPFCGCRRWLIIYHVVKRFAISAFVAVAKLRISRLRQAKGPRSLRSGQVLRRNRTCPLQVDGAFCAQTLRVTHWPQRLERPECQRRARTDYQRTNTRMECGMQDRRYMHGCPQPFLAIYEEVAVNETCRRSFILERTNGRASSRRRGSEVGIVQNNDSERTGRASGTGRLRTSANSNPHSVCAEPNLGYRDSHVRQCSLIRVISDRRGSYEGPQVTRTGAAEGANRCDLEDTRRGQWHPAEGADEFHGNDCGGHVSR